MKKETILVADDCDGIRRLLFEILKDEGYVVDLARDGKEAIEKASMKTPSLVILDVYMPGMSGIDTYRVLKDIIPYTPVVFLSAYTESKTIIKAVNEGIVKHFINKPFDLRDFLELIKEVIIKKESHLDLIVG